MTAARKITANGNPNRKRTWVAPTVPSVAVSSRWVALRTVCAAAAISVKTAQSQPASIIGRPGWKWCCGKLGLLPLPLGEGWGEGLRSHDKPDPPHPNPLPRGERGHTEIVARLSLTQRPVLEGCSK